MVLFSQGLQAHLPLGATDKLASPDLKVPFSCIMGESDWMRQCDEDYGKVCVDAQDAEKGCKFYILKGAGHNLHMDNTKGLLELII